MMSKEEIVNEAKKFLSGYITSNTDFIQGNAELKSLGLDSFRIIELVLFLERRTGFSFPDHAYTPANLKSIDSIVNCFTSLKK